MTAPRPAPCLSLVVAACLAAAGGCSDISGGDGGGHGTEDSAADTSADGTPETGDEEREADVVIESGPVTGLVAELAMIEERICDLDGDGRQDNVIADLGPQLSLVFVMGINAVIASAIEGESRLVFHLPWVEDLTTPNDPDVTIMILSAEDEDEPDDPTDDLSGHEGFYARASSLDACGEPLHYFADVPFLGGSFEGTAGDVPVPFGDEGTFVLRGATTWGGLSEDRQTFDLSVCGYGLIGELGFEIDRASTGSTTLLEALLAGGAPFGLPSVPGVNPDIDVDGDGLERLVLDAEGRVESCIDGDDSTIAGRDCYLDPRMADGFSFSARLVTVGAVFLGRNPGWEDRVEGECPDGPPEESLFDPR